jgi:hypothetical protein
MTFAAKPRRWKNSMTRKNFLFVFVVVTFLSTATWAQVSNKEIPNKEKVVAGAERGFEKYTKAYVVRSGSGLRFSRMKRSLPEFEYDSA